VSVVSAVRKRTVGPKRSSRRGVVLNGEIPHSAHAKRRYSSAFLSTPCCAAPSNSAFSRSSVSSRVARTSASRETPSSVAARSRSLMVRSGSSIEKDFIVASGPPFQTPGGLTVPTGSTSNFNLPSVLGSESRRRISPHGRAGKAFRPRQQLVSARSSHGRPSSSSTLTPISLAIFRSSDGATSRPLWNGTVVARPSACRNCLWEPRWRTSTNPSASSSRITS